MIFSEIFVWIYLPNESVPVVAGKITFSSFQGKKSGHFVYGKSYLSRCNALPLNPVSLPLNECAVMFCDLNGLPGVVADSCPDKWGMRVIDRIRGGVADDFPLGYLLLNDSGRVGNLAFSLSPHESPVELSGRELSLDLLLSAVQDIENNKPVSDELLLALHPGTGGARPKCTIRHQDAIWLAKFPSAADGMISIPRLEFATMQLAGMCGIHVASTELQKINDTDICMVKRFDREIVGDVNLRSPLLSARSVFYDDPGFAQIGFGSYARLARWMPRYGCSKDDKRALYKRMVFNVAVRNSDDHELNHGFVANKYGAYALSPAYDIVPSLHANHIHHHALLIGKSAAGTIENLLACVQAFDLSVEEARSIISEVENFIQNNWLDVFYQAGFSDEELRKLETCFAKIPAY